MALLQSLRSSIRRRILPTTVFAAVVVSAMSTSPARADDAVTRTLNRLDGVGDDARAWKGLFDAYLDMTRCPEEIGPDFGQVDVWPKMDGWEPIADWASSNGHIG